MLANTRGEHSLRTSPPSSCGYTFSGETKLRGGPVTGTDFELLFFHFFLIFHEIERRDFVSF